MNKECEKNKKAWDYRVYEFWNEQHGSPEKHAEIIKENPMKRLKQHGKYFENIEGLKIANPCGSNGRRAVALALLGAEVTVFDISEESKRYALELAKSCEVDLNFVVGDLYDLNTEEHGEKFDMLYLEGGVLHMFHDLGRFLEVLYMMLKPNGKIVLNDFHPFRKIMPINFFKSSIENYFDTNIHEGDVSYKDFLDADDNEEFPNCSYRYYSISEILNTFIQTGFSIKEFTESPSWTNAKLPGEFTVYANK